MRSGAVTRVQRLLEEGSMEEAAFLPVVAGQGGIAGTQTLTLVVRSMALGDVPPRTAF